MNKKILFSLIFIQLLIFSTCGSIFKVTHDNENKLNQSMLKINDSSDNDITKITGDFFTENKGQWDSDLLFIADTQFGQIGLGKNYIYYNIREIIDSPIKNESGFIEYIYPQDDDPNTRIRGSVIKLKFKDANEIIPKSFQPLAHSNNYFYGNDPTKWITSVKNYHKVVFENLWNSIDLVYYFYQNSVNMRARTTGHRSLCSL